MRMTISSIASITLCLMTGICQPARAADKALDLSKYTVTFDENFNALDVSARGPGTRWIAHTPWNGDFGDAAFTDPRPGFPFTTKDGVLRIEARRVDGGRWRSGLLSSVDMKKNGFAQQYGYFEMSARFPTGEGVWPAFWLIGLDWEVKTSEVDVVEFYGRKPDRYFVAVHTWDKVNKPPTNKNEVHPVIIPKDSASTGFHTYGVEIDAETTTFYFDRRVVKQTPTRPEHRQPMFVLVNLAAGGGYPITDMPNPSVMEVDYVKVWKREP